MAANLPGQGQFPGLFKARRVGQPADPNEPGITQFQVISRTPGFGPQCRAAGGRPICVPQQAGGFSAASRAKAVQTRASTKARKMSLKQRIAQRVGASSFKDIKVEELRRVANIPSKLNKAGVPKPLSEGELSQIASNLGA